MTKRKFLVLGHPRSRTTWLANLLTYGGSFCLHGIWQDCGRIERVLEVLDDLPYTACGCSDPLLYEALLRGKEELPAGLRVVLVMRDGVAAANALAAAAERGYQPPFPEHDFEYPDLLRVRYEDLDDVSVLESIWNHCTGGLPFDRRRASMLRDWNVQDIRWKLKL